MLEMHTHILHLAAPQPSELPSCHLPDFIIRYHPPEPPLYILVSISLHLDDPRNASLTRSVVQFIFQKPICIFISNTAVTAVVPRTLFGIMRAESKDPHLSSCSSFDFAAVNRVDLLIDHSSDDELRLPLFDQQTQENWLGKFFHEVYEECVPKWSKIKSKATDAGSSLHMPYLPAFTSPGWLTDYILRPRDEKFYSDVYIEAIAGVTVAVSLIPSAISYAGLANLPAEYGLYSSIVPGFMYVFFGSCLQLNVGPVALVSLLFGSMLNRSGIDFKNNTIEAVDFAAQASLVSGLLLLVMGVFNLGHLIRFISHPVMSGFTTGAAMSIGLAQVANAFGFTRAPQVGGGDGIDYNWQLMRWFLNNWSQYNPVATAISLSTYFFLVAVWIAKKIYRPTSEQKKTRIHKAWVVFSTCATLLAVIFAAFVARTVKKLGSSSDAQNLQVVGSVPQGLSVFRIPKFKHSLDSFILDILPLTIIAYMETYAVARKLARQYGYLSILNPSQELVALGVGGIMGCLTSCFPVSGSFNRSALNANTGGRTQLSSLVTVLIVCLVTGTMTEALFWIPKGALAAVVWCAVINLIEVEEFWHAWKVSKKDFMVMLTTFVLTLLLNSEIGLGVGLVLSIILLLKDLAFALEAQPITQCVKASGVEVIRLNSNLIFISASRIKEVLYTQLFDRNDRDLDESSLKVAVIDFVDVKHVDLTGLLAIHDIMVEAKTRGIMFVTVNVIPKLAARFERMHIVSDEIGDDRSLRKLISDLQRICAISCELERPSLRSESLSTARDLLLKHSSFINQRHAPTAFSRASST